MEKTISPFAKPLYVMTKPVGAVCNLACKYCYYLEKTNLYKENTSKFVMSDSLLESSSKSISIHKPCRKYCSHGMEEKP